MRNFKKVMAVGMTVALTVGSLTMNGFQSEAAGLPTTEGHNTYVNSAVFDVIGSDTFGSTPLATPLFDKTQGSQDITNLQVPVLAYDESSIGLVWDKPEKYDNIADYNVYINGTKVETARENFKVNAEWTATYMEAFYAYYASHGDVDMVNVDIHSYRATNLTPDTEYTFKVVAIDAAGNELGTAKELTYKTTAKAEVLNVVDYGAKTIEQWNLEHPDKATSSSAQGFVDYDDEKDAFTVANTNAIQQAINECPVGGKVVIPEGTFVSGAIWLKSDMTLEVNGTLWASANSDHFEIGFLMYPFYTDTRGWGLVNAMSADESAPITNVRVTGNGTLYGNGWKYGSGSTIYGDGYTSNAGKNTQSGDPSDSAFALPRFVAGNNTRVFGFGIQAADSAIKYLLNVTNEDGSKKYDAATVEALRGKTSASGFASDDLKNAYATRSSLLIMRNCENVYVGDITIENPSNHSVNILDSRNIATTNVKVFSFDGNNGDGLGFGCSQNVICWNNFTDTGDDNLGFGSSVGEGARDCEIQTNSEIWMFNNFLREGHGGLAAGSHTGNGIQDVLFEDTVMNHIDMAFRFKSAPTNGGFAANITMRDCAVADTLQGWVLTTSYNDANSASTTEAAEIGEFYNFASYNVSMYQVQYNTIQVLADIDPVGAVNKPLHSHHNLYFQDITFGNVGTNGSYKNKNGWETLIGCENAVFYNVFTKSYSSKAVSKSTDKAWNNLQYCKNLQFQGTTMDSLNACTDKMLKAMSAIEVKDTTITATTASETEVVTKTWSAKEVAATQTAENTGLKGYCSNEVDTSKAGKWTTGTDKSAPSAFGTTYASATGDKALLEDGTQAQGQIPVKGSYLTYTATEDGKINVSQKVLAGKTFYIVDEDGTVCASYTGEGDTAAKTANYVTISADVKAGKTYYMYLHNATATIFKVTFSQIEGATSADPTAGKSVELSWTAVENGTDEVYYGVDTYINDVKVDSIDGITETTKTMDRLSSGVTYTFKVYVSEKADSANSMSLTGLNKTLLGETTITTSGTDTVAINAPEAIEASTSSSVYTHTQAKWTNVAKTDARVRGYKIYVNGDYKKTVYNYEIASYATSDTVSRQIGRLTPGIENQIQIVAFTDSGLEYAINTTATTLQNYDYQAPVFAENAALTATASANGDVVLTWPAATDDTAVGGYRVYVDGVAVVPEGQDAFNPVNGAKTTTETTYTITGLDLTKDHTFTVQAGDTWWKAETSMGTFDKMAGFNWTVKGLTTTLTYVAPEDPTQPTEDPTQPTEDPTQPTEDPTQPTEGPTQPTEGPTQPTAEGPTQAPTNPTEGTTTPTRGEVAGDEENVTNTVTTEAPTVAQPEVAADETQTGDTASTMAYVSLLAAAFFMMAGLFAMSQKKKRTEK